MTLQRDTNAFLTRKIRSHCILHRPATTTPAACPTWQNRHHRIWRLVPVLRPCLTTSCRRRHSCQQQILWALTARLARIFRLTLIEDRPSNNRTELQGPNQVHRRILDFWARFAGGFLRLVATRQMVVPLARYEVPLWSFVLLIIVGEISKIKLK